MVEQETPCPPNKIKTSKKILRQTITKEVQLPFQDKMLHMHQLKKHAVSTLNINQSKIMTSCYTDIGQFFNIYFSF